MTVNYSKLNWKIINISFVTQNPATDAPEKEPAWLKFYMFDLIKHLMYS
jgi:hypothetical protein